MTYVLECPKSSDKLKFVGLDQLGKIDRDRFLHSDRVGPSELLRTESLGNRLDTSASVRDAEPKTQPIAV